MLTKNRLIFSLLLTSLFFSSGVDAQLSTAAKDRIIRAEERVGVEDEVAPVRIMSIVLLDRPIEFNRVFASEDTWLRDLKIRVKNVSNRRIDCVAISFGLVAEIDTKLATQDSWPWGIVFYRGKCGDEGKGRKLRLRPGMEFTLDASDIPKIYKGSMNKIGKLRKAVLFRDARVVLKGKKAGDFKLLLPQNAIYLDEPAI